jgi:UDP-3-O-[3-hydroxymyristoyl] glucosamine N-acyltransferase
MKNKNNRKSIKFLSKTLKIKTAGKNTFFENLGTVNSRNINTLCYAENQIWLDEAISNDNISIIITNCKIKKESSKGFIISKNPKNLFYKIHNNLIKNSDFYGNNKKNIISKSAEINSSCFIAEKNIIIKKNVVLGPNVCIYPNTTIEENVVIGANSVIGRDGFQNYRNNDKLEFVKHAGSVKIGKNVNIGANCSVDKGLFRDTTVIGDRTKIDSLVHIGHNVNIGKNCIMAGRVVVGGGSIIKNNSFIGLSACIKNGIVIGKNTVVGMGSVVIKNVNDSKIVAGNPAKILKKIL